MTTSKPDNLYTLPNGLTICHHNAYETDFVYNEVFNQQIYTKPFQQIPSAPCVVDVGANIGLFSLLIKQRFPNAVIYAFEPSPVHFELLQKNLQPYQHMHCLQKGLGVDTSTQRFTYYPHYSVMSGFHADANEDRQLLAAGIAAQMHLDKPEKIEAAERYIELLMENKLDDAVMFDCQIMTLSALIDEKKLSNIDLLKIDAEKAEQDVLKGINEGDWSKIDRIVLEAHDKRTCENIIELLKSKGFHVSQQKSAEFKDAAIFIIYASRVEII